MSLELWKGLLIPFAGTTLGAACVFFMRNTLSSLVQRALTGFAAGVMVAASIWSLLLPAMEQSAHLGAWSFLPAAAGFWLGILFLLGLDRLIPHLHQGSTEAEGPKSSLKRTTMLTLAVALKNMVGSLGADVFFETIMTGAAASLYSMLPAIIFVAACVLAFSSGTSWGTFSILIPIVAAIFPVGSQLLIIGISACLAGAVCGDHCSPISDTTIMASAGAQCDHVNHVSTQLPYAITCAVISGTTYIVAGLLVHFGAPGVLALPVGIALMLVTLLVIKRRNAARG